MFPELAQQADNARAHLQQLEAQARETTGVLDQVDAAGSRAGGGIKGFASGLMDVAGKAGMAVFGATQLVSTISNLAGALFTGNAAMEQTGVAFETMMHSAGGAKDMLAQIQKMAAATPFEFPDLAKAAQLMLAFGTNAKDVVPTLTIIGDTVSSFGGGVVMMEQIVRVLGQMHTAGKVQAQDMMQLSSLGIAGWQMIADAEGKSVAQIQAMSQAGQLLSSTVVPELLAGMDKAFGGGMQKQAATFNGMLSTISDNLKSAFRNVSMPFFVEAEAALKHLVDYTSSAGFAQTMENWKAKADDLVHGLADFVVNDGPMIISLAENTAKAVGGIADKLLLVLDTSKEIVNLVGGISNKDALPSTVKAGDGTPVTVQKPPDDGGALGGLKLDPFKLKEAYDNLVKIRDTIKEINSAPNSEQIDAYMHAIDTAYSRLYQINTDLPPSTDKVTAAQIIQEAQERRNAATAKDHADTLRTLDIAYNGVAESSRSIGHEMVSETAAVSQLAQMTKDGVAWQLAMAQARHDTSAGLREETRGIAENAQVAAQGAGQIAAAFSMVTTAARDVKSGLMGISDEMGNVAGIYATQASGFQRDASALTAARDAIIVKQQAGITVTAQEQTLLDNYPQLYGRAIGGVSDATIQEGLATGAKVALYTAQENLNTAIANGETNLQPYIDKVQVAKDLVQNAQPDSPMAKAMGDLDKTMGGVKQAVDDLVIALGILDKTNANPTVSLDDREFARKQADASGGLDALDKRPPAMPQVDMDNAAYIARKVDLDASLDGIDQRQVKAHAGLDTTDFDTGDSHVMERIGIIDGSSFWTYAKMDTSQFDMGIQHVSDSMPRSPAKEGPLSVPPNWDWMYQGIPQSAQKYAQQGAGIVAGGAVGGSMGMLPGVGGGTAGGSSGSTSIPAISSGAAAGASQYLDFVKQLLQTFATASDAMGTAVGKAKTFADDAGSAVKLMSDVLALLQSLGTMVITNGPAVQSNIANLKFITEKIVTSIGDSAQIFHEKPLNHLKVYADDADSAVKLMQDTLGFVKDLGDTVVLYGDWQARAIANLKFIAEKAVASLADCVAAAKPLPIGFKEYSDAIQQSMGALKATLDFIKVLGDDGTKIELGFGRLTEEVTYFTAASRLIVEEFSQAAALWNKDANPNIAALNADMSASIGALTATVGFLKMLSDLGKNSTVIAQDITMTLPILIADIVSIATAFQSAASTWKDKADPKIAAFAADAGASLTTLAAVPNALTAILNFGAIKKLDVPKLAAAMVKDIDLIVMAIETAKDEWIKRGHPSIIKFADDADRAVALMSNVADAMTKIAGVSYISHKQADVFDHNFRIVLGLIRSLAAEAQGYLSDALSLQQVCEAIAAAMTAAASAIQTASGTMGSSAASAGSGLSSGGSHFSGGGSSHSVTRSDSGFGNVIYLHPGKPQEPIINVYLSHTAKVGEHTLDMFVEQSLQRIMGRTG